MENLNYNEIYFVKIFNWWNQTEMEPILNYNWEPLELMIFFISIFFQNKNKRTFRKLQFYLLQFYFLILNNFISLKLFYEMILFNSFTWWSSRRTKSKTIRLQLVTAFYEQNNGEIPIPQFLYQSCWIFWSNNRHMGPTLLLSFPKGWKNWWRKNFSSNFDREWIDHKFLYFCLLISSTEF